ncbi:hypothetical protein HDV02_002748 [Globomyces sp. JEL0801]|nr:hypothetical protein HDV02_002748 [Globomyces sp. JEL0801]
MRIDDQISQDLDVPCLNAVDAEAINNSNTSLRWFNSLQLAVKAIVSIRFSQVAAFDTEPATSSEATGFVVDKDRGIILTNRHVACSGPFVGDAIWHNHEEVEGIFKLIHSSLSYL